jgi:S-adenosylmethionine:tRNA ribosyltransferase-isomerase
MKLSLFDYVLPKELVAQYPLAIRDRARLLVVNRKKQTIEHGLFCDLSDYFSRGDLLVLNDSKVLPCRLFGSRLTGGKLEILLLKRQQGLTFEALVRPARVKLNEKIIFNNSDITCRLIDKNKVTFFAKDAESIYNQGVIPLPPYIKRAPEDLDNIYYQTVYARKKGSIASPTAGLHFTKSLINKIRAKNINIAYITLHVGYSTFKPVKCEDVTKHKMEKEYFKIADKTAQLIDKTKAVSRRICAVGTTTCRTLEAYFCGQKEGYTGLFIYPGYKFKVVDSLITNFHLPKTTLFMLVCGFAGEKLIKQAYEQAVDKKYRFYSYGDAMLII